MKPDPRRLSLDTYPFHTSVPPRISDLDVNGHINNVAMATIIEEAAAKLELAIRAGLPRPHFYSSLVAAQYAYLREAQYGKDIEVGLGVEKIGSTSWTILSTAFQDGHAVATCDAVNVRMQDGAPAQITAEWRERISPFMMRG
jgi:acyl-CoA thioester hydrolase